MANIQSYMLCSVHNETFQDFTLKGSLGLMHIIEYDILDLSIWYFLICHCGKGKSTRQEKVTDLLIFYDNMLYHLF